MAFAPEVIFNRVELLAGSDGMRRLAAARVVIFGVGGVGSWAAESLVRTGISHLTLVDPDVVAATNINRQLMALQSTVGRPKAEVLAQHLRDINPAVEVEVVAGRYTAAGAAAFALESFDYVIDAIDSLADKAALILHATAIPSLRFFSSMGAALRVDPRRVEVAEFWKVDHDALAAALRRRFRKSGEFPRRKFLCVFSREQGRNRADVVPDAADTAMRFDKVAVNGALAHITAIFGFTLAGLVVGDILSSQ